MAPPENKKWSKRKVINRSVFSLLLIALYIGLFASVIEIVITNSGPTQKGELLPGQTASLPSFSHSLDLRVAKKNVYPSEPISIVQEVRSDSLITSKTFKYKVAPDGLTEYGLMMLPSTEAPAKGFPTIILCHGYVNPALYSTIYDYTTDMEFYALHGFAVIKPDFRGQGMSINQGKADSAYYSISYNTDLMSLITAIKKTNYLDKDNINMWGHSMGAYLALRTSVVSSDIKNTILLSGPVADLETMYLTYIPPSDTGNLVALKSRNDVFAKYGTPVGNRSFWHAASPTSYVSQTKTHIQIHVGLLDQTVPPQLSADLDQALTKAHAVHDYYVYPEGSHSLAQQRNLIWARSLSILQSLPATTPG